MRKYRYRNASPSSKMAARSISGSLSRFLSVFAIIALGAGVFAGLRSFVPDMNQTADTFYDRSGFMDLRVTSMLGLTQDDVDAISKVDGVVEVMKDIAVEATAVSEGRTYQIALSSVDPASASDSGQGSLNRPILREGRLPERRGEIALFRGDDANSSSLGLGDTLTVEALSGFVSVDDFMQQDTYTLVGFITSPVYIENSVGLSPASGNPLTNYGVITSSNFADPAVFTDIYVTVQGAAEKTVFTDAYDAVVENTRNRIKDIAAARQEARYQSVKDEADAKINDAQKKLDEGKAEADQKLAEARLKIADAKTELANGEKKLADGQVAYDDGVAELAKQRSQARARFDEEQQKIDDGWAAVTSGERKLNSSKAELDAAAAELAKSAAAVTEGRAALAAAKAQRLVLVQQKADLQAGIAGLAKLDQGIAQAETELSETQASVVTLNVDISGLEAQIADPATDPALIPALQGQVAELQARLAQAQAAIPVIQGTLTDLNGQRAALMAQIGADPQSALAAVEAGIAQIDAGIVAGEEKIRLYEAGEARLASGRTAYDNGVADLNASKQKLTKGESELDQAKREAERQFSSAQQKLDDAKAELDSGRAELADGKTKVADGEAELTQAEEDARVEIAKGQIRLDDARKEIDKIEAPLWYILDRDANQGAATYAANRDRIAQITTIFPIFFFLVAALVSLTTMTRMVESERGEIGTLKGLGYNTGRISRKYTSFAGLAAVLGSILGIVVGVYVFPKAIWIAYGSLYSALDFEIGIYWRDILVAFTLSTVITLFATLAAIAATLREHPTELMLPKAPKPGKRILLERLTPLWSRLKFSYKVTARNLFRYKKRLIMTVLGVAGCTALLLTGFGIRDHLSGFLTEQYTQIFKYNVAATLEVPTDEDGVVDIPRQTEMLDWVTRTLAAESSINDSMFVSRVAGIAENPTADPDTIPFGVGGKVGRTGGSSAAEMRDARSDATQDAVTGVMRDVSFIVAGDPARYPDFIVLSDYRTREPVEIKSDQVVITQRLAENLQVKPGDTIDVSLDPEDPATSLTVSAIVHNYVGHHVYLSQDLYARAFHEPAPANTVLIKNATSAADTALTQRLKENPSIKNVSFTVDESETYDTVVTSLNAVVIILILVSAALAFIVLYNLSNINIEERIREIATIKVLGFFNREVDAYVFRETIILSLLAVVVGLPSGYFLTMYIMRSAELDNVMFGRVIEPVSYVIAVVLTIVFTILVIATLRPKLRNVDMVSSLKNLE